MLGRVRGSLDAGQWRSLGAMAAVVVGLHAVGFFLLIAVLAPQGNALGRSGAFLIGTGLTAYTLGLRHAFDADHITAIDNTTRKLMAEGKRPLSVGFWFSLGHSSVVFALSFLIALGVRAVGGQVAHRGSTLHAVAGWVGTGVSGTFLYAIAALNVVILWEILKVFASMRRGAYDEAELERRLQSRGLMNRVFGRFARGVGEPWHMYPIGVLFGLGFDTASEVGLLFLAAGVAGAGLPFYAIICLPILFAAGMSLLDTIDGSFMNFAYGWAFSKPVRKVFYNLTITGLSVAVALVIGTIELVGLLAQKLGAQGSFWGWWENVDINTLGLIVAGLFVLTWVAALLVWRLGRVEERWSPPRAQASGVSSSFSRSCATDSNTAIAPASRSSSSPKPVRTVSVLTPASSAACTSHGVSPTITASSADPSAR
jgi:high-affinity nickel-transport protein